MEMDPVEKVIAFLVFLGIACLAVCIVLSYRIDLMKVKNDRIRAEAFRTLAEDGARINVDLPMLFGEEKENQDGS